MNATEVTLRYLEVDGRTAADTLVVDDAPRIMLERIGVAPAAGRSQLARWLEVMAAENGCPIDDVRAAVNDPENVWRRPGLMRWVFAIA